MNMNDNTIELEKFSGIFSSFDEAKVAIYRSAMEYGFGLRQSSNGNYDKERFRFQCTMEGETFVSNNPAYKRKTPSRCGCRYAINLYCNGDHCWVAKASAMGHNHSAREVSNIRCFRKMTSETKVRVAGQLLHSAPLHIRAGLKSSGIVLKAYDVYNLAHKKRKEELENDSPFLYVLQTFSSSELVVNVENF